jgi:hypothetical protein
MTEPHDTPRPDEPAAGLPKPPNPWFRLPYLVLFAIVFEIAKWLVALVTVVQFVLRVTIGHSNERLRHFGDGLAAYLRDVVAYLTYASDAIPYPFGPWPKGEDR